MISMMNRTLQGMTLAIATLTAGFTGSALAQTPVGTASIHGHVNNAAGVPIKGATVEFTKQMSGELKDRKWDYKFTTDDNGDYKGKDIAPGELFGTVVVEGKNLDYIESLKIAAGDDKTANFDMSRADYIAKMSDEDKKALEEYKKKFASVNASNKVVANLNATLTKVRADLAEAQKPGVYGDVSKDVDDMKTALDSKADESVLWIVYADTLNAQGDHLAHEDRVAKKSVLSDDAVIKAYTDATAAYQKGADLNAASKKPVPTDQAIAYNQQGNAFGKLGKVPEASAAFENAVKLDPTKAGMYYNNEAAILYNSQQIDGALAAAEKAIAADPNRPDPYYIKGQALVRKASVGKDGKIVLPEGCEDAYQHFLAIAGDAPQYAPRVKDVKEVLAGLNIQINTKYNANSKKK